MRSINLWLLALAFLLSGCDVVSQSEKQTYVCITFDDQHQSIFTVAYPLMEQYGFSGTLFINTSAVGSQLRLNWAQIDTMVNSSGWETGGHTLHHVELPELTYEDAYDEIYLDYLNLVEQGLPHHSFALPSGHATEAQFGIISEFYDNIRTSMNVRHYAPLDRLYLGYLPFQVGNDPDVLIGRIIEARENNEDLVILGFHSFEPAEDDDISFCEPAHFQEILEFISANNMTVLNIHEACELLGE
ncbi:polysaccharide deacetylase family protein [Candidatus Cloacimonadota bacterium]